MLTRSIHHVHACLVSAPQQKKSRRRKRNGIGPQQHGGVRGAFCAALSPPRAPLSTPPTLAGAPVAPRAQVRGRRLRWKGEREGEMEEERGKWGGR
eukprot:2823121-Rhodomonas_salina.1